MEQTPNKRPLLGITMGDPAGIGPEIVVKTLAEKQIYNICRPLVIGDYRTMKNASEKITNLNLKLKALDEQTISTAQFKHGTIDMLDLDNVDLSKLVHGTVSAMCGKACYDYIAKAINLAQNALVRLGIENPRIAVAALNPHASDNGLFGTEEQEHILPAIEAAKSLGINADGPIPPDTCFSKTRGGQYDIAVAMYHDQGHIPLKLVGFIWDEAENKWNTVSGVNVTLGLPIIRTSVDHGVAFGKAGKGTALPDSMIQRHKTGRTTGWWPYSELNRTRKRKKRVKSTAIKELSYERPNKQQH